MSKTFSKILAAKDNYVTESRKYIRYFGPTFSFYIRLAINVFKCNRLAVKGKYDDVEWVESSLRLIQDLEKSGVMLNVQGMENLNSFDGPAIFISNHMSTMETMAPVAMIHPVKRFVYVIKQELATYPLFGKVVMARDPIVVGRANPREDLKIVLEEGAKRLDKGKSILLFPQKTRSQEFNREEFNSLGVKLAKRKNVPVVPMAVLTDAWGNGKVLKDFGEIDPQKESHFAFGKPIYVESSGKKEHELVMEFISTKLKEWGREELVI